MASRKHTYISTDMDKKYTNIHTTVPDTDTDIQEQKDMMNYIYSFHLSLSPSRRIYAHLRKPNSQ